MDLAACWANMQHNLPRNAFCQFYQNYTDQCAINLTLLEKKGAALIYTIVVWITAWPLFCQLIRKSTP